MESYLAFTASTDSKTTNFCRLIRDCLESHLPSNHRQDLRTQPCSNQWQGSGLHAAATTSSFFINAFNIPNVKPSSIKSLATGNSLWRKHHCCAGIKDSTSAAQSLYKYTWQIMIYMILTGEGRLRPNIWPKTFQQAKSTKSIMRAVCNTKAMRRQNASGILDSPLSLTGKSQNMCIHSWSMICVNKIADMGIKFKLNHGLYSSYYRKNPSVGRKSLPIAWS